MGWITFIRGMMGKSYQDLVDLHKKAKTDITDKINAKYDAELEALKNEATPPTNTPTNADVQLGASNVGETRNTKQESPVQESVSSSVDGGEVKGDSSVGENPDNWSEEKLNAEIEKLDPNESLGYGVSRNSSTKKAMQDFPEKARFSYLIE